MCVLLYLKKDASGGAGCVSFSVQIPRVCSNVSPAFCPKARALLLYALSAPLNKLTLCAPALSKTLLLSLHDFSRSLQNGKPFSHMARLRHPVKPCPISFFVQTNRLPLYVSAAVCPKAHVPPPMISLLHSVKICSLCCTFKRTAPSSMALLALSETTWNLAHDMSALLDQTSLIICAVQIPQVPRLCLYCSVQIVPPPVYGPTLPSSRINLCFRRTEAYLYTTTGEKSSQYPHYVWRSALSMLHLLHNQNISRNSL